MSHWYLITSEFRDKFFSIVLVSGEEVGRRMATPKPVFIFFFFSSPTSMIGVFVAVV